MKISTSHKRIIELILFFVVYPIFLAIDVVPLKIKLIFVPFLLIELVI